MAASPRRTLSSPSKAATTRLRSPHIAQQGLAEQTDTAPLTTTIPVTFTDLDLSDVGHAATVTGAVATGTTTGLALNQTALIALVTPGTVTKAAGSSAGSVNLSFSAASTAFDYLAKGEVLTLTYTVAIDDGDGGVTPKTFVVTITGTNDDPVVAAADVTGAVTEQVAPAGNLTDSGTIALADVDLTDTHIIGPTITASAGALGSLTATVDPDTVNGLGGAIKWSYSVPDSAVEYLAKGEIRIEHFTIALDDGHGGTVERTIDVTITGTNDAPVLTASAPSLTTITEDQTANAGQTVASFLGASIADVDHGALQGIAITATTSAHGHWEYSADGSTFVAFPAVSGGSALLLAATDMVRFVPDGKDGGTDTFTYVAWDQTTGIHGNKADVSASGGSAAFSVTSDTATLTVTAVNDAPTAAAPATHYAATEQTSLIISGTGLHVADIDGNGGTETVTLSVGVGILDVDLGGNDVSVTGDGTSSVTITGLVDYIEALLSGANSGTISYTANVDNPSASTNLMLSVNDHGNSGSGGSHTATATATIDITPVNDAPVTTDDLASIIGKTGSISGHLLANDTDAEHNTLSVSAVVNGVAASGHITVDGTYGEVVIDQATGDYTYTLGATSAQAAAVAALGHNVTVQDDFTYTASDGTLGGDGHLKVSVTGVSEAPVLSATLNFVFQQSGGDGATLVGTAEKDVIFATGGNDTLTGNAKADQFVFAPESQPERRYNYRTSAVGEDHIDLRAFSEFVNSDNINAWLDRHKSEIDANGVDTLITLDTPRHASPSRVSPPPVCMRATSSCRRITNMALRQPR